MRSNECAGLKEPKTLKLSYLFEQAFKKHLRIEGAKKHEWAGLREGGDYIYRLMQEVMNAVTDGALLHTKTMPRYICEFEKDFKKTGDYCEDYLFYPSDFGSRLVNIRINIGQQEKVFRIIIDGRSFGLITSLRYCIDASKRYEDAGEWDKVMSLVECYSVVHQAFFAAASELEPELRANSDELVWLNNLKSLVITITEHDTESIAKRGTRALYVLDYRKAKSKKISNKLKRLLHLKTL